MKIPYLACCQHLKSDLSNKSLRFNEKERERAGNVLIAELRQIEVDGKTILECIHGDKNQRWLVNDDFTRVKI